VDVELKDTGLDCIQTGDDFKKRTNKTLCTNDTDSTLTNRTISKHFPEIYDNQAAAKV